MVNVLGLLKERFFLLEQFFCLPISNDPIIFEYRKLIE